MRDFRVHIELKEKSSQRLIALSILISWVSFHSIAKAQNLDKIGKTPPITVNGGANLTGIFYGANGIPLRRDPFTYYLNAHLNFDIYGMAVPLSFSYSNQKGSFTQPFNRLSLTPSYKWVKAYIGHSSFSWSPYTLNGHSFFGGGVEATPGNWSFTVMYGRLRKEVQPDSLASTPVEPVYKRMGYGGKIGYQSNGYGVQVSILHANDIIESLNYVPDTLEYLPGENLALGVSGTATIISELTFNGEIATSIYTQDITLEDTNGEFNKHNYPTALIKINSTTEYFNAFNARLSWQKEYYAVTLGYERVDPGYQTMGAYFFNNDLENITIGPSVSLLKNRINIAANLGIQHNNLDELASSENERYVGSVNASYVPNKKWNFSGNYSNFTTYTNIRPQVDPFYQNELDTLNFYQVSSNSGASVTYSFGGEQYKQSLFFTGSYQTTLSEQSDSGGNTFQEDISQTHYYNSNVAYRILNPESSLGIAISINLNRSEMAEIISQAIGPTLSVNRSFLEKKLKTVFATTYNHVSTNNQVSNKVINIRINGSYSPAKQHAVTLNLSWVNKLVSTTNEAPFNELTTTINYGYNF